jgi:hypothetical protein
VTHDTLPPTLLQEVERVRRALLLVHRALLQVERMEYEGEHGRIEGNSEFMRLVLQAPRFAWLRPLLALVVEIDELLAAEGLANEDQVRALVAQARECLRPDEHGDRFQQRYFELLQEAPAVVIAHGEALKLLRPASPP